MKVLFAVIVIVAVAAQAQFIPSEKQYSRFTKHHHAVAAANERALKAQSDMQREYQKLLAFCTDVARENHWPDGLHCDPNNFTFQLVPQVQAVAPATIPAAEPAKK